jgi:hypothetical protein
MDKPRVVNEINNRVATSILGCIASRIENKGIQKQDARRLKTEVYSTLQYTIVH